MFGGPAGLNPGLEGSQDPTDMAAAAAGYGAPWGSTLGPNAGFDPSGMSGMMNVGLFGMPATAAAGGYAAANAAGYDPMAAMAAAGFHSAGGLSAENSSSAPFGSLLHGPAGTDIAAGDGGSPAHPGAVRHMSRANSSSSSRGLTAPTAGASRTNSGPNDDAITPRGTSAESTNAAVDGGSSNSMGRGSAAGKYPASAAAAAAWPPKAPGGHYAAGPPGPGMHQRAPPPPPLHVPSEGNYSTEQHPSTAAAAGGGGTTTPRSPAAAGGGHGGGMGYPAGPHSPHVLGPFGPLFHPISPAGRFLECFGLRVITFGNNTVAIVVTAGPHSPIFWDLLDLGFILSALQVSVVVGCLIHGTNK